MDRLQFGLTEKKRQDSLGPTVLSEAPAAWKGVFLRWVGRGVMAAWGSCPLVGWLRLAIIACLAPLPACDSELVAARDIVGTTEITADTSDDANSPDAVLDADVVVDASAVPDVDAAVETTSADELDAAGPLPAPDAAVADADMGVDSDMDADAAPLFDIATPDSTLDALDVADNPCATPGTPCDDGNACTTVSTCLNGKCAAVVSLLCDDQNPCTDDSCSPQIGCVFQPNSAPCSDGNPCTVQDACANSSCKAETPKACPKYTKCVAATCQPLPKTSVLYPVASAPLVSAWYPFTSEYQSVLAAQGVPPAIHVQWFGDKVAIAWRSTASEDCHPVVGALVDTGITPARVRLISQAAWGACSDNNDVKDYYLELAMEPSLTAVYVDTQVFSFQNGTSGAAKLACKGSCQGVGIPVSDVAPVECGPNIACTGLCLKSFSPFCQGTKLNCPAVDVCVPSNVCAPGQKSCGPGAVLTCKSDGKGWTVERCKPGVGLGNCAVVGGVASCQPPECAPGIPFCDATTAHICDPSGKPGAALATCGGATSCLGGSCLPVACTTGAKTCSGLHSVATCGAQGWVQTACPDGQACKGGACVAAICEPGARMCAPGGIAQCDATGTAKPIVQACPCYPGTAGTAFCGWW